MTDQELRDAITTAGHLYSGHVTVGSCEELLKLLKRVRVPLCPKCGSPKLSGPCGHTWEIEQ